MSILESGILNNSSVLLRVSFTDELESEVNLTIGLLEAITAFAKEIFEDEIEVFKMKQYSIFIIRKLLPNKEKVTFYSICKSKIKTKAIRKVMAEIAERFYEKYSSLETYSADNIKEFKPELVQILGDLVYKPEDRLRRIFVD